MKNKLNYLLSIFLLMILTLGSCKKEKSALLADHLLDIQQKELSETNSKSEYSNDFINVDEKILENKITTKSFYKNEDSYIIDYRYPVLDVKQNRSFKKFNDFITNQYLDYSISVKDIINKQKLSCQIGYDQTERLKRLINYKIYTNNSKVLSILLYKANHYVNENQYSYLFKTLNFDTSKGDFIFFNTLFREGTEREIFELVRKALKEKIQTDQNFEQCSELTYDTFLAYKDNFVIDKNTIKFYFDDCVICPVYSGNYFVEISRSDILDKPYSNF